MFSMIDNVIRVALFLQTLDTLSLEITLIMFTGLM